MARALRQNLWLIALNLAEDDQAQIIFETLNARGTPLTPGDLVKNILLRRAQDEGANVAVLYDKYWRNFDEEKLWQQKMGAGYTARPRLDFFLQQALTVLTSRTIPMSGVYDSFVSHLRDTKGKITATQHLHALNDLSKTAHQIFSAEESDADRSLVAAARIRAMDFTTAIPVLMVLLNDPNRDAADIAISAVHLESFLVRRMVCGLNTGMYGLFFVKVMNAAAKADRASDEIVKLLMEEQSDSTRWPDDREFGEAWRKTPLYKTLRRNRLTMILRALERSLRNPELTDSVEISEKLHVEHLMPQSWGQWWPLPDGSDQDAIASRNRIIQTIGNLTLLKERLNERLSNAPWRTGANDSKRSLLQQHGLMRLNTMVSRQENWDEAAISARSDELLGHAIRVWMRPNTYQL